MSKSRTKQVSSSKSQATYQKTHRWARRPQQLRFWLETTVEAPGALSRQVRGARYTKDFLREQEEPRRGSTGRLPPTHRRENTLVQPRVDKEETTWTL